MLLFYAQAGRLLPFINVDVIFYPGSRALRLRSDRCWELTGEKCRHHLFLRHGVGNHKELIIFLEKMSTILPSL